MKFKERQAQKIATTNAEERCYLYGWDDALELASQLCKDLKQPQLALLIKAVGSAEVDENGKVKSND